MSQFTFSKLHQPVLLQEVMRFLEPKPGEFIIDGTVDGGGHTKAILKKIGVGGKILGIDWDDKMILNLKSKILDNSNLILAHGNYAELQDILKDKGLPKADGLLLDLGFSSEQLENSGRGFSFRKDEPLLMTYDKNRKPVKKILQEMKEKELAEVIFKFSGEKFRNRIARAIKERQKTNPIESSRELAEVVRKAVPINYEKGRIDPATRTFQALRIYANDELNNLEKVLKSFPKILKSGGRAAIISFHNLEDKIVKDNFRKIAENGAIKILTKKPIRPGAAEIKSNPRSRSARLRAAAMI